jgi:hypothetical protein
MIYRRIISIWLNSLLFVSCQTTPNDFDVKIVVGSPTANAKYGGNESVWAAVHLQVGEGPMATSLRESPSSFDLCMTWDTGLFRGQSDDDDFVFCKNILSPGELPSLVTATLYGSRKDRTFRTWIRDTRPDSSFSGQLAQVNIPYHIEMGECIVGVCLSGTLRTFASKTIRERFLAAMYSIAGEHCKVELLAHVTVAFDEHLTSAVPWTNTSWTDDGTGGSTLISFEASNSQISEAMSFLNETLRQGDGRVRLVGVKLFNEAHHYTVPNGCPNSLPPSGS